MREILFRGKRIDINEWIEGYYAVSPTDSKSYIYAKDYTEVDIAEDGLHVAYRLMQVIPETIGQYTGLTDKNGKKIFEGDIVRYYHHKKSLVPVTDIKPEEDHYGRDEESGLPLAYRTTKIIRYKGHVELDPISGMTINLKNRCEWWRHLNYEDDSINSDRLEVIGNVHDGGAYD